MIVCSLELQQKNHVLMMNSNSEILTLEFSEGQQAENAPRASLSFV